MPNPFRSIRSSAPSTRPLHHDAEQLETLATVTLPTFRGWLTTSVVSASTARSCIATMRGLLRGEPTTDKERTRLAEWLDKMEAGLAPRHTAGLAAQIDAAIAQVSRIAKG